MEALAAAVKMCVRESRDDTRFLTLPGTKVSYLCFFSHSSRDIALSGSWLLPWRLTLIDCNVRPVMDWNWLAASSNFF
jgi:hypothetical protein